MHLKVFVKLKKTLKTLSSGQKNPKKPKKTQKNPKKKQKTPLGWVFLKKPGFFPTLGRRALVNKKGLKRIFDMRFSAVQFVCCICFLQTVVQNVLLVLSGDHPAKPALSHFPCANFMYFYKMAAGKIPT
jgi:hypothetical protein